MYRAMTKEMSIGLYHLDIKSCFPCRLHKHYLYFVSSFIAESWHVSVCANARVCLNESVSG